MSYTLSPNMNLPIPGVGTEGGPAYALDVNASLTLIDSHDHTAGKGAPITPSAMNINADLSMQNFSLTDVEAVVFTPQSAFTTITAVYVKGVDLFYRDGDDNEIQLTIGGNPAGGGGSITGLPDGTAGVDYSAGVYTFSSATNTPANIRAGSILIGNNTVLSNYLTLAPPTAMATNTTITLPAIPAGNGYMLMDNTGAITTGALVDNSTIEFNSNVLRVKPGGIGPTQLAGGTIPGLTYSTLLTPRLTFTVSSASATVGAIYTNNGYTFTVLATIAGSTSLTMSCGGPPSATGTLTKASGTGDTTITFSSSAALAQDYTVQPGVEVLYVEGVGGGGGGGGGGTTQGGAFNIGGGGGGEGSMGYNRQLFPIAVTEGETLSVIVGIGGRGGGVNAGTAASGGASQVKRGSTVLVNILGGAGGVSQAAGGGAGGGALGANNGTLAFNTLSPGAGGGGAGTNTSSNSGAGASQSIWPYTGGLARTPFTTSPVRGAGGGGGASPYANGGNGSGGSGGTGSAGTLGSGGGGGHGDEVGFAGGNGQVIIYYVG